MKTIKFVSNDKNQQEFARAVRKNVNNYFKCQVKHLKNNMKINIYMMFYVINKTKINSNYCY